MARIILALDGCVNIRVKFYDVLAPNVEFIGDYRDPRRLIGSCATATASLRDRNDAGGIREYRRVSWLTLEKIT